MQLSGVDVRVFQNRMHRSAVPPPLLSRPCWWGDQAIAFTAAVCSLNLMRYVYSITRIDMGIRHIIWDTVFLKTGRFEPNEINTYQVDGEKVYGTLRLGLNYEQTK